MNTKIINTYLIPIFILGFAAPCHIQSNQPFPRVIETTIQQQQPKADSYYIFNSEICDLYLVQLKNFLDQQLQSSDLKQKLKNSKGSFAKKTLSLITLCENEPQTPDEKRHYHEDMLVLVRELAKKRADNLNSNDAAINAAIQFVDSLCEWMYTSPDLLHTYQVFLQKFVESTSEAKVINTDFIELIGNVHVQIKSIPHFSGYIIQEGKTDDHYAGYVPSYVFDAFSTPFILTPRTSMRDKNKELVPEFKNYLKALKYQNKSHLYVNLMNRTDEAERKWCLMIEEASSKESYKDVFYAVSLDKNSDFYYQKNAYESDIDVVSFKKQFFDQMFNTNDETSHFKWPVQLDPSKWQFSCREILDEVHLEYYKDSWTLSVKDRQDFIEITLVKIVKNLCKELHPTNANISCRSTIDRGPSLLFMVYAYSCLEAKNFLTIQEKTNLLTILFAPPLFSHNRPSHDSRIERAQSALKALLNRD